MKAGTGNMNSLSRSGGPMLAKNPVIKSKKLTSFAKGKPCTIRIPGVCESRRNTTVACHLNSNYKGTGNKSPDLLTVIGCSKCHAWIDREYAGKVSKAQRDSEVLRAFKETLMEYVKAGLITIK